jgi:SAM-dependent methyltransferase
MSQSNSTRRFTDRVDDYVRSRPSYPSAVLDVLQAETGRADTAVVADVGSGTGISAALFLGGGYEVYGVEPNDAMRAAAEARLGHDRRFHSVAGTAEATTLPDASVDLIVAAQAFHWFDVAATRREFARILRPDGSVMLMWNTRRVDETPFLRAYEALLLEYATDYRQVDHRRAGHGLIASWFGGDQWVRRVLPNEQLLDWPHFQARVLSSSYTPAANDPQRGAMLAALADLFTAHQEHGTVRIAYDTELYLGRIGS